MRVNHIVSVCVNSFIKRHVLFLQVKNRGVPEGFLKSHRQVVIDGSFGITSVFSV